MCPGGQNCPHLRATALEPYIVSSPYWVLGNVELCIKRLDSGASLVAQWLRNHLPMLGTRVQAVVREDPTCRGATKPVRHNYWACALEPTSHNYWARMPQLLKPACLEPVLHSKRSHHNKKPAHHKEQESPLTATRERPCAATKTQRSQNLINFLKRLDSHWINCTLQKDDLYDVSDIAQ